MFAFFPQEKVTTNPLRQILSMADRSTWRLNSVSLSIPNHEPGQEPKQARPGFDSCSWRPDCSDSPSFFYAPYTTYFHRIHFHSLFFLCVTETYSHPEYSRCRHRLRMWIELAVWETSSTSNRCLHCMLPHDGMLGCSESWTKYDLLQCYYYEYPRDLPSWRFTCKNAAWLCTRRTCVPEY